MSTLSIRYVAQPPSDAISKVAFANSSDKLLASSWDSNLYLYSLEEKDAMTKYEMKDAILDCTFGENDNVAYCGGLDCAVMRVDLPSGASQQMGSHIADTSVRCVNYCGFNNTVLSGGWDGHIMQWDPRQKDPCVADVLTRSGHRVYTMDVSESKLVVGLSDRVVHIYDVRKLDTPEQERESSIANQTRCLRCSPDGNGFVMGTIEGRVAVEFLDPSPKVQEKKYAFKCHRKKIGNTQTIYPLNTLAFHPVHGTFATGGADGVVSLWDGVARKKMSSLPTFATSVASLAFNAKGTKLAIAVSYTFEEGDKEHPPDAIAIVDIAENQMKPKS